MEKVSIEDIHAKSLLNEGAYSRIYLLDNGQIFKMFSCFVTDNDIIRDNIEKKILYADQLIGLNNIILPEKAVYSSLGKFMGYTMDYCDLLSISDFYSNLSLRDKLNIEKMNTIFQNITLSVKNLNKEGIIMPDLCTYGNVLMDKNMNAVITDYDGLQIFDCFSMDLSSSLGNHEQYLSPKYLSSNNISMLYTDNIDKKSLSLLFFNYFFGIDLERTVDYYKKHNISPDICIKNIFSYHNVNDEDLFRLVSSIYNDYKDNSYFDEISDKITKKYDLAYINNNNDIVSKKLIMKR